ASTVSANRQCEPRRLRQLCRGELDWIVMKALEKDRDRRYETASAFAADIERHLRDEPVQACPPSTLYRLRKFVRPNRVVLATTAVVGAALILGTVMSVWQASRATRAEAEKEQKESAAQRSNYVAHMTLAQQAWARGNIRSVMEHLDASRPGPGQQDLR